MSEGRFFLERHGYFAEIPKELILKYETDKIILNIPDVRAYNIFALKIASMEKGKQYISDFRDEIPSGTHEVVYHFDSNYSTSGYYCSKCSFPEKNINYIIQTDLKYVSKQDFESNVGSRPRYHLHMFYVEIKESFDTIKSAKEKAQYSFYKSLQETDEGKPEEKIDSEDN
ncbi:MAG: hypothetical protein HWN67_22980 [Candidatus Helarchaeota archaeon]|nr:hypothetical protein [Candidatus Helarchaeota archaeon]